MGTFTRRAVLGTPGRWGIGSNSPIIHLWVLGCEVHIVKSEKLLHISTDLRRISMDLVSMKKVALVGTSPEQHFKDKSEELLKNLKKEATEEFAQYWCTAAAHHSGVDLTLRRADYRYEDFLIQIDGVDTNGKHFLVEVSGPHHKGGWYFYLFYKNERKTVGPHFETKGSTWFSGDVLGGIRSSIERVSSK